MKTALFCSVIAMLAMASTGEGRTAEPSSAAEQSVSTFFEPYSDLLSVKLAADDLVDPSTNTPAVTAIVERMASDIKAMAGPDADSKTKLTALRRYLYEAGPWNAEKPFSYDQDDPLGKKAANRLLQRYLTTRRGNCITMPMLMMFIGQRIGLKMTLAEAPLHLFIKYTDDDEVMWNLEATSGGGFTRDIWYRQKLPMSDKAVQNGVYLRPLTHSEAAAVITSIVVEHEIAAGDFEQAIALSDAILAYYPNFAYLLVKQGNAYSGLLRREFAGKYAKIEDIPPGLRQKADEWYRKNGLAFSKAEALGWTPNDGNPQ